MQNNIPDNFDEAIQWVLTHVEGVEKAFKKHDEQTFALQAHESFGRWIRNNWGFWKENTNLYFWFLTLGIQHPDDMSDIIIRSAYRTYHKKDIMLDEQVQFYKDFWKGKK